MPAPAAAPHTATPRSWLRRAAVLVLCAASALTAIAAAPPAAHAAPSPGLGWEVTAGGVVRVDTGVRNGNVTGTVAAVNPRGAGHITVWPCEETRPTASVLNYQPARNVANSVVVKTGSSGSLCFYSSAYTHLLWDQVGSIPAANAALRTPSRSLDTRNGMGARPAGSTTVVKVAASKTIAVGTLTVVAPQGDGHATVWPCGVPKPATSTINYSDGVTIANSTIVPTSPGGDVCIATSNTAHLLWDNGGELRTTTTTFDGVVGTSPKVGLPTRLLDTRNSAPIDGGKVTFVYLGAGASAAVGTLTVVAPQGDGHATVWPCGVAKPATSTINYTAGVTTANSIIASVAYNRAMCIYTSSRAHLVWDSVGDMRGIGSFGVPQRKLDTRVLTVPQHPRTGGDFYPNVSRWRDTVWGEMQALNIDRRYLPGVLAQIQQESAGIPNAVNNWDSNWVRGYASFGLLQTIYPTFNSYTRPDCRSAPSTLVVAGRPQQYTSKMVDPSCNIYAGLNYVLGRYQGRLFDTWNTGKNLAY